MLQIAMSITMAAKFALVRDVYISIKTERARERERDTETETETKTERDRERDGGSQRGGDTDRPQSLPEVHISATGVGSGLHEAFQLLAAVGKASASTDPPALEWAVWRLGPRVHRRTHPKAG